MRSSLAPVAEVFRNPDLRRLLLGSSGYFTGDWAYTIALAVFAYRAGGPAAVGLVGLIRMVPAAVIAPFGSMLADRYRRERVLTLVYLSCAVIGALSATAYFLTSSTILIFVLAGLISAVSAVLRPAHWALVPLLATNPRQMAASNAASSMVEGVSTFVGPAIGAALLVTGSAGIVFAATAAMFAWSAFITARITSDITAKIKPRTENEPPLRVAAEGFRILLREPGPRLLVALFSAQTLVRGLLNVLLVVASVELLGLGESGVGILTSAFGVGGIVGTLATLWLVGRRRLAGPFGLGLALWGLPIALVGFFPNPAAALVLLALPGVGNAIGDVAGYTLVQRLTKNDVLARVFGVLEGSVTVTLGIGYVLAAPLLAVAGTRGALIITGLLLPVLVLASLRALRRLDRVCEVPERELSLLGQIPLFSPLPVVTREQLASALDREEHPAGRVLVREGQRGDRFYIVAEGEVLVSAAGREAATLGPGDYFGEIALLRDVPRTATVSTTTSVVTYALNREEFIGAVTGHVATEDEAETTVAARLAGLQGMRES
ncbi:MAG TPA: MFS transporter [Actinomycetota bacterium]|nr:MFS transporter [Actinomycetota bacterium]